MRAGLRAGSCSHMLPDHVPVLAKKLQTSHKLVMLLVCPLALVDAGHTLALLALFLLIFLLFLGIRNLNELLGRLVLVAFKRLLFLEARVIGRLLVSQSLDRALLAVALSL